MAEEEARGSRGPGGRGRRGRGVPGRGGRGQHVGRRRGAAQGQLAGSPHLLRRALLQHVLLHGHGPRGGGVRFLAPLPALAAEVRRTPGSGADGRGGQRPHQPGAKAMAAGVHRHRGQAARRGLRGPPRQPHVSARPASARLVRGGPGHGRAAGGGAREGASKPGRVTRSRAPSPAARGPLRGREQGDGGSGRPEWRCPPPSATPPPLPSPNRRHRPRRVAPPPQSPARRPP